jgi:predicted transcriptional regulator
LNNKTKRLGDAELDIMMVLWSSTQPVTSGYILEQLKEKRSWALSTLMTSLARLSDKEYIYCDRTTRSNLYSPIITENEYKARESKTFLARLYGNSLQSLVTNLYSNKVIDQADIKELQKYLKELEEENKL